MTGRSTVLIVDDNAASLFALEQLLSRTDAEIVAVRSGQAALAATVEHEFALAILDVQMPEMDGYELAATLRNDEKTRNLPIVFVSAVDADEFQLFGGYESGAVDFLHKPFPPTILLNKVQVFLELDGQRRALREHHDELARLVEQRTEELRRAERRQRLLSEIGQIFLTLAEGDDFDQVLQRAMDGTGSPLGTFGYVNDDGALVCPSRSEGIRQQCRTAAEASVKPRESWGGVWGTAVIGPEGAVADGPERVAGGDTPVARAVNVPIRYDGEVIGSLLVANKPTSYVDEDRAFLETVAEYIAPILSARLEREREEKARHASDRARTDIERQLRMAQRMEALGQVAGGVAHDFNNLLTAILGYSGMTLKALRRDDPLRENVEQTIKAGKSAVSLNRQLLAFSRRQVLQPTVMDINATVREMEKMLARVIGENIILELQLAPDLARVKADVGQVEQVLMNLVVNARDAMPRGGRVTIETRNVDLDGPYAQQHLSVVEGPYAMLAVSDNGHGMDRSTVDRVFEPFFTTKEKGRGTGMGLSTVYGIVKQSGGNIWAYSEPDQGTTFKVYLPKTTATVETRATRVSEVPAARAGAETVLIIEDEKLVRALTQTVLREAGYNVLVAGSGEEALRVSADHPGPIHLFLVDIVMPGASGPEVVDALSRTRRTAKVLFMSGYTDHADAVSDALEHGAAFIEKPFGHTGLTRKVRTVLDSSDSGEPKEKPGGRAGRVA